MNLSDLGWDHFFAQRFDAMREEGYVPGRVAREDRQHVLVYAEAGEFLCEPSGHLRHSASSRADLPAVGDWVALAPRAGEHRATIHGVLERRSQFVRKVAGTVTEEQVLAANVTTVFLVTGLDGNFNVRRIERYLTLAWESGAVPVVVLSKADICPEADERTAQVEEIALGATVLTVSALTGTGMNELRAHVKPGDTIALLGSSGVGKSTMINALAGEELMQVRAVREDDSRGRHTTTHRELVVLPNGGILIDTPGMRELQLWGDADGLSRTFQDVESLAAQCRFSDCGHAGEPGCAVRAAIEDGSLAEERYGSYLKLQRELAHLARKQDVRMARQTQREFDRMVRRVVKERKARRNR